MDGTNNPNATTADRMGATLGAGQALHDALCNLNIKVRPGAAALLALTAADWNFSPAEADEMRATVEWVARHLVDDLAGSAAALDASFLAAGLQS